MRNREASSTDGDREAARAWLGYIDREDGYYANFGFVAGQVGIDHTALMAIRLGASATDGQWGRLIDLHRRWSGKAREHV